MRPGLTKRGTPHPRRCDVDREAFETLWKDRKDVDERIQNAVDDAVEDAIQKLK
jgi:hypothetical protein